MEEGSKDEGRTVGRWKKGGFYREMDYMAQVSLGILGERAQALSQEGLGGFRRDEKEKEIRVQR
jgi:hypothetical protein